MVLKRSLQRKFPKYYEMIGLPLSLNIIQVSRIFSRPRLFPVNWRRVGNGGQTLGGLAQLITKFPQQQAKLKQRESPTMIPFESDLRRMVGNAKSFNEKSSEVFSDAEKIRKAVVNYMTKNNPAYQDKSYVPGPTPIPEGWQNRLEKQEEPPDANDEGAGDREQNTKEVEDRPLQVKGKARSTSANATSSRGTSSPPTVQDADNASDAGESFDGDTFQRAQEKIITELISLKNEESVPP